MARAVSVEPVKATPAMRGSLTSGAPTLGPSPGTRCSTSAGTPALCSRRTASAAIIGVCSAGLATTRVAGGERGAHLAEEDREREVPRRDAGEHAAAVQLDLVALAGRAGQRHRPGEIGAGAHGVVAQEIDRLAQLRDGVGDGLAGFADAEGEHIGLRAFQQIGGALQARGAVARGRHRPVFERALGAADGIGDLVRRRVDHLADGLARVGGIDDGLRLAGRAREPPTIGAADAGRAAAASSAAASGVSTSGSERSTPAEFLRSEP